MRCLPHVDLPTDVPFWVSRSSFLQHFDQDDFLCRQTKSVVDAYLGVWFYVDADGTRFFKIPPVSVNCGRTQFISGRHRTAVLLRYLDRIPLSFDTRHVTDADRVWIDSIVAARIETDTVIELPDLPIRSSLPVTVAGT
jgi:hypothetical protein